ncbi:MAG: hypothetical protein KIT73_05995 [Burkholderiales bacterium]|nr:hypothetical protein [Burkholderiales bacterium]
MLDHWIRKSVVLAWALTVGTGFAQSTQGEPDTGHQQAIVRLLRAADVVETMKIFAQGYLAHAGASPNAEEAQFRMLLSVLVNTDRALVEPFLVGPLMSNLSTREATLLADFFESPTGHKLAAGVNSLGRNLAQDPATMARQLNLSESEQRALTQILQSDALRAYLQLVTRPENVRRLLGGAR